MGLAAAFGSEKADLSAFHAALIALARRDTSPRDRTIVLRKLFDDQRAAFRALAHRQRAAKAAARERRWVLSAATRVALRPAQPS